MLDTQGKFFLGRLFDVAKGKLADKALLYDPADLTTHALVTGMTGSGKTGLCIGILEEAALQNIPAIIIDPKGDLTNLLLHFPELAPQDFQPWLDADVVRREGKTLDSAAKETAEMWKKGLGEWGIDRERLLALKNAAEFAVYTPGSDAGIPVSVLSSLAAPIEWEGNREILRERIASTVTAILGLVGMDNLDPLRSREHILLSNIFETAWSQNRELDFTELILQTQSPPFDKLGAFSLESFFPAKDRMDLAIVLNNILAAPGFEIWREGWNLDIPSLLWNENLRPRHSVFYIAHLSDAERMFFVTLLLSAVETWMRTQAGSATLRVLVYMDEIFGYFPPTANPPSKLPMLRLLKQARAFGVGMLLATQNPVDVDYKGLSNMGTWFIGKLQTDQDKQRLLDGLEGAAGGRSRSALDKIISALGKRAFVLNNVHEKEPVVFQTRWAMNYLAGPMTRGVS
jgi:DNA helicase HerA-like ATPase